MILQQLIICYHLCKLTVTWKLKSKRVCEQVMFDLDMYFLAGLFAQDDQDTVVSLTHFVEVVIAGLVGL